MYDYTLERFTKELKSKIKNEKRDIAIFCIGTNSVVGDSLGPRVGSFLRKNLNSIEIQGDMEKPICYKKEILGIKKKLENKCIIVIDSAVSYEDLVGQIFITKSKMDIGSGIGKRKAFIGDISIKAVVSKKDTSFYKNFYGFQNVNLGFIENMSNFIGRVICGAIGSY